MGAPNKKGPPLPWWPRDFASDEHVKLMTFEMQGVYRYLLDHAWLHGSIPADVSALAFLCEKMPLPRFRKLWERIAPCFVPVPGDPSRLQNGKLERVRSEAADFRANRQHAGRLGGQQKASKSLAKAKQTASKHLAEHVANVYPPTPSPPREGVPSTEESVSPVGAESAPEPPSSGFVTPETLARRQAFRRAAELGHA